MSEVILQVRHLSKAFGKNQVLRDIDFTVSKAGEKGFVRALSELLFCDIFRE